MDRTKLSEILKNHELWLKTRFDSIVKGERANLRDADLRDANLRDADLRDADLRDADLRDADLRDADLRDADLRDANLRDADLRDANLRDADLRDADLRDADLRDADLRDADLYGAVGIPINCPETGSFIGYKKAFVNDGNTRSEVIVKLRITENAKRSSATGRKCRCNEAEVLEIKSIDESLEFKSAISSYDYNFIYKVGETVRVGDFEENRFVECAPGIHFFITRQEAVDY